MLSKIFTWQFRLMMKDVVGIAHFPFHNIPQVFDRIQVRTRTGPVYHIYDFSLEQMVLVTLLLSYMVIWRSERHGHVYLVNCSRSDNGLSPVRRQAITRTNAVRGLSLKQFQTNFARQQMLRHGYVGDYHFVVRWPVSWVIFRHCQNALDLRLQRPCSTLPLIRLLHVYMHWTHWATGQNGRHFADDIFKCIFLNGNVWLPITNSLTFVSKGSINNIPALTQIMAWRRPGDKPLSEPNMFSLPTHICVPRPHWANIDNLGPVITKKTPSWDRDSHVDLRRSSDGFRCISGSSIPVRWRRFSEKRHSVRDNRRLMFL